MRYLAFAAALCASPAPALESIWLEGEAASSTTFNRHPWYEDTNLRKDLMSPGRPETADGDWLAHYTSGVPNDSAEATWSFTLSEGGSYAWWLRLNPLASPHRVSVDGGPFTDLDLADYREVVNVVQTIDIRWLAWVRAGTLVLAPGSHTVRVQVTRPPAGNENHGGIDCMALANFPWEPVATLRPGDVLAPPGPAVWFPLRAGDDPFSPDSITDMSRFLHTPAGRYGPLTRAGDRLEFRDRSGVDVKLWGVNVGAPPSSEALQRQQARFYAKYGVNLVRLHPVEDFLGVLQRDPVGGGRILDPSRLDRLDRWFALLKERGIYLAWSCFYPHVITPDDAYPSPYYDELPDVGAGKGTSGLVNIVPELQDAEWTWLRALLAHVNPYTGIAYKDDPALALIEVHNEDSVFWHAPLNELAAGTRYPAHTARLKGEWMSWLSARYGSDAALAAAWGAGMRPGDSVSNPSMDVYGAWQMTASGPTWGAGVVAAERPRLGDFIRFLAEAERAYFDRRRGDLAALGYRGVTVTTAWRAGGPAAAAANLWCDDAGDAIDRHAYFGGGAGGWYVAPGAVNSASHLGQPGHGIVGGDVYDSGGEPVALYPVEDKPVVMTEWSQSPPNEWKAEAAPLHAFYGMGLQGWDASMHFAGSLVRMGSGWPSNLRAPSPFVSETPHYFGQFPALAFALHNRHVQEGELAAARRLSPDALFAGSDPLSQDLPGGGYPGEPSLRTPPEVGAIGRVTFAAAPGLAASAKLDWDLSWDRAAQVVRSTTGELEWDYGRRVVTLRAPKTQAVIGFAQGMDIDLPGALVHVDSPFVSLLLTPLDDLPLVSSEHILVTALARDRQVGTQYSPDGTQLLRVGGPPLLLEPVQASITFRGAAVTAARVVDIHGVPTAIDVARNGNTVVIDGRYEAYYYEVKKSPDRCLARTQATVLSPLAPARDVLFLAAPGADGLSLSPAAPLAQLRYVCGFAPGGLDPEAVLAPGSNPLIFYQVSGTLASPLRAVKDAASRSVRFSF